ncbi:MAG: YHYH protein [Planctomycetota bacterium]
MNNHRRIAFALATLVIPVISVAHPDHGNDINPTLLASTLEDVPVVSIDVRDGFRYIRSNGIPAHEVGQFPNAANPNAISPQRHMFKMTTDPQPAERRAARRERGGRPSRPVLFGVALNGVPFDPATAEIWRNGTLVRGGPPQPGDERYEAIGPDGGTLGLDANNAHVQPTGTYHYHGLPTGLIEKLGGRGNTMLLIGWAADGYPIYAPWAHEDPDDPRSNLVDMKSSYRLKESPRPEGGPPGDHDGTFTSDFEYVEGSGDLDRFNGRVGVTPEFPDGTFYYVLTEDFPFIPREHYGTPDPSFSKETGGDRMGGPPRRERGNRRPPRGAR